MRTKSLWSTSPAVPYAAVDRDLVCDVIVIGGGITGATASLRLAETGKRVALVEARAVGSGVTARTTAHLTEAVDPRYTEIRAKFGKEGAALVAASTRLAMDHVAARVSTLAIDCDLARLPAYLYAERAEDHEVIAHEHQAALEAGLHVELADGAPLPFATAAALRYPDQLRIHPRRYVDGLVRAAVALGAQVFERTRVVGIEDGEPVVVTTDSGHTLRAAAAFSATHVPLNAMLLQTKLAHYQSYAMAFAADAIPSGDALCFDTAHPYHYVRRAAVDGRDYLVVGGEDHKTGEAPTDDPFQALRAYAAPRFGTDMPAFEWSGQVIEPVDGLPFIGRNSASKHVYVATGFSGNGMTYGTLAALIVSDLVLGLDNPYAALFHATRVKPSALGTFLRENKDVPAHLIGDRLAGGEVDATLEIERDEGKTMKLHGKHLAVYRDPVGALHAVSAVCPHMSCLVHYNRTERSWDCPCHGSRFSVDGDVLDGPAVTPLAECTIDEDDEPQPQELEPLPA